MAGIKDSLVHNGKLWEVIYDPIQRRVWYADPSHPENGKNTHGDELIDSMEIAKLAVVQMLESQGYKN